MGGKIKNMVINMVRDIVRYLYLQVQIIDLISDHTNTHSHRLLA